MAKYPWPVKQLGEAGKWFSGGTPSKKDSALWSGPIPWVSPKDMKVSRICGAIDHVSEDAIGRGTRLVDEGHILIVVRGMILAHSFPVALTVAPVAFNQDIKALRPADDLDPEFTLYWLQNSSKEILRNVDVANHGTKRLPTERLHKFDFPIPPLPEQRKIAAILSSVDDTIEKTENVIEQLQVVKKAMMQELLTRGLPGRHRRFKETEIGVLPEGWGVAKLSEITTKITDGEHKTPKRSESGVLLLSARNVRDGYLDLGNVDYVPEMEYERISRRCQPEYDDIFISCSGTIGRICRVPKDLRCGLVRSVALVKPNRKCVRSKFLEFVLRSPILQKQMALATKQAAQPNLFQGPIRDLRVPLPSSDEQKVLGEELTTVENRQHQELIVLNSLRSTKNALMGALLTGDLRV